MLVLAVEVGKLTELVTVEVVVAEVVKVLVVVIGVVSAIVVSTPKHSKLPSVFAHLEVFKQE